MKSQLILIENHMKDCHDCIKRLLPPPPKSHKLERFQEEVLIQFTDFRARTGLFDRSKPHWNVTLSPSHFWRNYQMDSQKDAV